MATYDSAFDAACCGGPTLFRYSPAPSMEECVVCEVRKRNWPEKENPCPRARSCHDFAEFTAHLTAPDENEP